MRKFYLLLFAIVSCVSLADAQIAGTVVDGKDSRPLGGVNIYLQRDSTGIGITDGAGKFEIAHVGKYGRVFLYYKILKSLPRGIHSFCSFMKEGKIYIVSGIEDSYVSDEMFVYDIAADMWTESPQKIIPRFCHAAVYYGGKVFIVGGKYLSANCRVEYTEPRIEIYDMNKDTVYVDEVNPHQAADPITFVYDSCLYVMGGTVKKNKYSNKIHVLDLKTGVWYDSGINIPKERRDNARGALIGDIVYFFGGSSVASM